MVVDKIKGMFWGFVLGDSLGAPHEFPYQKNNYTGKLERKIELLTDKGIIKSNVGQWTDDTYMTFIVMKNCLNYDHVDVLLEYLEWSKKAIDIGINMGELFRSGSIDGYIRSYRRKFSDKLVRDSTQSNGAMMRCSFLAFGSDDDIKRDTMITNPNDLCLSANLWYVRLLRKYLFDYNHDSLNINECYSCAKEILDSGKYHSELKKYVKMGIEGEEISINNRRKGWVMYAVYCVAYCDKKFTDYKSAIDWTIKKGGDTDTNAAIVGAVMGARFGYNEITKNKITKKNMRILMNAKHKKDFAIKGMEPKDVKKFLGRLIKIYK